MPSFATDLSAICPVQQPFWAALVCRLSEPDFRQHLHEARENCSEIFTWVLETADHSPEPSGTPTKTGILSNSVLLDKLYTRNTPSTP